MGPVLPLILDRKLKESLRDYLLVRCSRLYPVEHLQYWGTGGGPHPKLQRCFCSGEIPLLWLLTSWAWVFTPRVGEFSLGLGFCWCSHSRSRHQVLSISLRPSFLPFSREPSGWPFSLLIFFLSCWDDKRCSSNPSRKSAFLRRAWAPSRTTPQKSKTWQFLWDSFQQPAAAVSGTYQGPTSRALQKHKLWGEFWLMVRWNSWPAYRIGVCETYQCFHGKRWLPGSV